MRTLTSLVLILITFQLATPLQAEIKLPRIFTSHMILQQEKPIRIWGWTDAGESINVSFAGQTATTKASSKPGTKSQWIVQLPAQKADGKSHTLVIKGSNTITLNEVKLGEVWIAAGQSNMNRRSTSPKKITQI